MNQKKVLYLPSWFEKKRKNNIMEAVQINENLNLRGQKSTGILIGYVLTLALMFCAFEYTQRDPEKVIEEEKIYEMAFEEDMIPITQQQEVMAPPPAAAPKVAEIINIVDNETELPDEEESFCAQPGPECNIGIARVIACTVCIALSAHLYLCLSSIFAICRYFLSRKVATSCLYHQSVYGNFTRFAKFSSKLRLRMVSTTVLANSRVCL